MFNEILSITQRHSAEVPSILYLHICYVVITVMDNENI